jgi:hypothetical protein
MRKLKFYQWLLIVLLVLSSVSCENLFNPNAEAPRESLDADGLIQQGEVYLRQNRDYDAYQVFRLAVEKDSTKSLAYYGMGKAALRRYNVNPFTLIEMLAQVQANNGQDPVKVVGDFLITRLRDTASGFGVAMDTMSASLEPLIRRDTLTDYWMLWTLKGTRQMDSVERKKIQIFDSLINSNDFKYRPEDFPLVDGKIKAGRLTAEMNVGRSVAMMKSVSELFSGYEDVGQITDDLSALASGEKTLEELDVFKNALSDTNERNKLNDNLDSLSKDINKLKQVAGSFTTVGTDSTANSTSDSSLQKQIDDLGPAIAFYKIADRKDNDGDGCIDEEIYDGIDNDGDGFVDEDIRGKIENINDFLNNDLLGGLDDPLEKLDSEGVLLFTQQSNYLKGPKYQDKQTKLNYIQDTSFVLYPKSLRKAELGGCWSW